MKKRMMILVILPVVAHISSMDRPEISPNYGSGPLIQYSEKVIQDALVSLEADASEIQEHVKVLKSVLAQEVWTTHALKELLVEYDRLKMALDAFPLRHKPALDELRFEYRMDRSVDAILQKHTDLYTQTIFALSKEMSLMFDLQNISNLFASARSCIQHKNEFCTYTVSGLKKYQNWSSSDYKHLQNFITTMAQAFLKRAQEDGLYEEDSYESKEEEQRLHGLMVSFKECEQGIIQNMSAMKVLLAQSSETIDVQKIYDSYQQLLVARTRLETIKKSARTSAPKVRVKKLALIKELDELHKHCSRTLRKYEKLGIKDLKNILMTFDGTEKALHQAPVLSKAEEPVTVLKDPKKVWFAPQFPLCHINHLSRLLVWQSPSESLQATVRAQAKKYLQQIDEYLSAVESMEIVIEELLRTIP